MLSNGSQIANATLKSWLALMLGSVAAATLLRRTRSPWCGWLCAIAALLGVLAVIDTVSVSTGGIFASLAFASFVVWLLTASIIIMYRRPL